MEKIRKSVKIRSPTGNGDATKRSSSLIVRFSFAWCSLQLRFHFTFPSPSLRLPFAGQAKDERRMSEGIAKE